MKAQGHADTTRSHHLLLFVVALLIAVAYGQVLLSYARGRWVAPLRDDLVFFQYARSLGEGHPYRFFPGAERTTGATSHLYVFVLALLYRVGMKGDLLAAGAFFTNAVLWLAALFLIHAIARRQFEHVALAAALLVALTGPVSFAFFAGHDVALATTLILLALYGLLEESAGTAAVALFLLSWARPEGAALALALVIVALAAPRGARRPAWAAAGLAGLLGTVSVMLFNLWLTGHAAFSSMQGKGVVGLYPFHSLLVEVSRTAAAMVREILVGWTDGLRGLYFVPLLGVVALLGFVPRCRAASAEAWLLISAALVVLIVSVSGFAGVQHDKYLVWILILLVVYAVAGLPAVEQILVGRLRWQLLWAICAIYAGVGTLYFLGDFGRRVAEERAMVGAVEQARSGVVGPGARVGVLAGSGVQYYLPANEVINLGGVTHQAFGETRGDLAAKFEILEDRPPLRPDVWLLSDAEQQSLAAAGMVGPLLLSTPAFLGADAHLSFYAADYDLLGVGEKPLSAAVLDAIKGRELVDEIDLGLPEHETAHGYTRFTRAAGVRLAGGIVRGRLGEQEIVEAGYAVLGDEEFAVRVRPGKDLLVVVRTSLRLTASSLLGPRRREQFEVALTPPVRIEVFAGGQAVGQWELAPPAEGFDEQVFPIPARHVTESPVLLRLAGDHIAYHYWFFQ